MGVLDRPARGTNIPNPRGKVEGPGHRGWGGIQKERGGVGKVNVDPGRYGPAEGKGEGPKMTKKESEKSCSGIKENQKEDDPHRLS